MKVIAFNGSPRKEWNTATLLKEALSGAASKGAAAELIHLYDFNFKGCTSCFACKQKGGKSLGRCAMVDDLTPIFKEIEAADAIVLGSPVYLGSWTGEMRSFLERLAFPYYTYSDPPRSLFPKKIRVGMITTFGATEEVAEKRGWLRPVVQMEFMLTTLLGEARSMTAFDMYQFDDYSKYECSRFDPVHKANRRRDIFPQDRRRAFDLGLWLAGQSLRLPDAGE